MVSLQTAPSDLGEKLGPRLAGWFRDVWKRALKNTIGGTANRLIKIDANGDFAVSSVDEDDPTFNDLTLTGEIYFGDRDTNGSWRFVTDGDDLAVQRRESGAWVEKSLFRAT